MDNQLVPSNQGLTLRANGEYASENVTVLSSPIDKPKRIFGAFKETPSTVMQVSVGYTFKILGEERDCYRVETYSGKVGYVLKDKLIAENAYQHQDHYPRGKQAVRTFLESLNSIFAVDSSQTNGIYVKQQPDDTSKIHFYSWSFRSCSNY